ncbi:MAG: RsmD family RNA methyltransferase [Bacteroidota bacterium]|nr:RsmD family RNA methyltransferase [Bacteroidota bacterium]
MRIISGKYKSKQIIAPKNLPIRPTTDLAKESLFNILNNYYYFDEIKVLDLFSGSGNIAYEFASRGTQHITAVDAHSNCTQFIRNTADKLDFNINVIKSDVFKFLEKNLGSYDIIFADPPYDFEQEKLEKICQFVFERNLLNSDGMLIIEHQKDKNLEEVPFFESSRKYGGSIFSFFQHPHDQDDDILE